MNPVIEIFMRRDNMTREEAEREYDHLQSQINYILSTEVRDFIALNDIEDLLADYSLEPDYLDYFLF